MLRLPSRAGATGRRRSAIVEFVAHLRADGSSRPGRGAGRGVRQRRHAVVRAADADPARLHPAPARRDGRGGPSLRDRQPWKAAHERDHAWFGAADGRALRRRRHATCGPWPAGSSPPTRASASRTSRRRRRRSCAARAPHARARLPRVRVRADGRAARYLEANGFANYIVSGGGRDFMRPISEEIYGIPRERVVGSTAALAYTERRPGRHHHAQARGRLPRRRPREADPDLEPHGRRPCLPAGNSNGDVPMLSSPTRRRADPAPARAADDDAAAESARRRAEFAYTRAPSALERAAADGWTVVSVKDDWTTVFTT